MIRKQVLSCNADHLRIISLKSDLPCYLRICLCIFTSNKLNVKEEATTCSLSLTLIKLCIILQGYTLTWQILEGIIVLSFRISRISVEFHRFIYLSGSNTVQIKMKISMSLKYFKLLTLSAFFHHP